MPHVVKGPIDDNTATHKAANLQWSNATRVMLSTPPHGEGGTVRIDWAMVDEAAARGPENHTWHAGSVYHIAVALAAVRDGTWKPMD